jgi:hypothetical protein
VKKLLAVIAVCFIAWTVVKRHRTQVPVALHSATPAATTAAPAALVSPADSAPASSSAQASPSAADFACDGRVYCSQMSSCDEAKYFLAHCPGVKMDGDGDGIPCERQFCGS